MLIYKIDDNLIFTGETKEILPKRGVPLGWTRTAPPEIPEGKFCRFLSGEWTIIDEMPAEKPDPVPERVSQRQARLVLLRHGYLDQIPSLISAIEDDSERASAQIEWEYASQVYRYSPLVVSFATALGILPEQMDNLFREANQIPD